MIFERIISVIWSLKKLFKYEDIGLEENIFDKLGEPKFEFGKAFVTTNKKDLGVIIEMR